MKNNIFSKNSHGASHETIRFPSLPLHIVYVGGDFQGPRKDNTIYLGPGEGFGSGRHPTTRMCLSLLTHVFTAGSPSKVLDAGTGNGILSIALARMGAYRVLGIEKSCQAADTARRNIFLNRLETSVYILQGDLMELSGSYDLIVANLNPDQIAQLSGILEKRLVDNGDLIISGLRGFEKERVLRVLSVQRKLRLMEDLWEEGWSAIWMHKPGWKHRHRNG